MVQLKKESGFLVKMLRKLFILYFDDSIPAKGWRRPPPVWLVWTAPFRRLLIVFGVFATVFASPGVGGDMKLVAFEGDLYLREDVENSPLELTGERHKVEGFSYSGGLKSFFGGGTKKDAQNILLKNARSVCPLGFKLLKVKPSDVYRGSYSGRYPNGAESFGDMGGAQLTHAALQAEALCVGLIQSK